MTFCQRTTAWEGNKWQLPTSWLTREETVENLDRLAGCQPAKQKTTAVSPYLRPKDLTASCLSHVNGPRREAFL